MRVFRNFGYKLLAFAVALLLWGVANSTSSIERGFDLPIELVGVPENLVVTDRSSDAVNVRVRGSRAALRAIASGDFQYPVELSGARAGGTSSEVDLSGLKLPRGAQIVSRSPSTLDFTLERRGTKAVRVRADLEGEPASGFELASVEVRPERLRITGARSEVLRLNEVLTETIDVTGVQGDLERKVTALPGGRHVWLDGETEITVRISVRPIEGAAAPGETG